MSENTRTIIIDGEEITVPQDYNLLQAAEAAGREIPRFCYHERLSVAGNCRMCLVELVGAPKPVASCAFLVRDMRGGPNGEPPAMRTLSPLVKKAREGVMEFLLINHPLDCPICDQGGECDLQDQSLMYGRAGSRYGENKRAVEDKYMGPLIKTVMTRCIQCTRCVRFATEIAGVPEVGAIGRGEDMEITTYLEQSMTSELSGNVIDLCPVGALTSRPYAFNARPWELTKTETIDVMDAIGSNIRVDSRSGAVLRILPRIHEGVNEEWISDKTRFVWDGLGRQRLDKPYVRKGGKLTAIGWDEALTVAAEKLSGDASKIGVIAGDLNDTEGLKAAKDLFDALGVKSLDCRQDGSKLGGGPREGYLFNTTIAGIDKADAILLIGTNPRVDAPVLNARIRQRWLNGKLDVAMIGEAVDLTYPYEHLGSGPDAIGALAKKRSGFIKTLKDAKNPIIILGSGATARADGAQVLRAAGELAKAAGVVREGWNGFSVLHTAASRVGALDLGFLPGEGGRDTQAILDGAGKGEVDTVVLLGADEIDTAKLGKAFVIYAGHHGDAGAMRADLILPSAAYTEKPGLYVNTEGRAQLADRAVFPKGEAKEDWAIFRALSARLNRTLPYDSLNALRAKLIEEIESFGQIDHAPGAEGTGSFDPSTLGEAGEVSSEPFVSPVKDFYLTNAIARASKTMAECSAAAKAARATLQAAE
ncbi:NADH-quinone oxidoreductase [Glycocaulis albus]|uniref:NADH-quinone oxidoreductase n=1 Tax=Glycocaulis albus TaxID=1382801 RepID=A0ABQ1XHX5_9PROT|nr:NADH-quinone oxidoreductase subunit NuoG [Glycocaulis albus]MBV5258707.1 NADH-quinone oxidoreductase subunit G [Synechococcus moorigangaii CMS01]GGG93964.1 NADH-quinone oxidoreductase [Glycocaulis albus]